MLVSVRHYDSNGNFLYDKEEDLPEIIPENTEPSLPQPIDILLDAIIAE